MIDNLSYNLTGQLGPLYPRPEYRPPSQDSSDTTNKAKPGVINQSGKRDLKPDVPKAHPKATQNLQPATKTSTPASRLTLAAAQTLTEEVSAAIAQLPPGSTNAGPHRHNPYWGLIYPKYV
jgi:hypothetical protein